MYIVFCLTNIIDVFYMASLRRHTFFITTTTYWWVYTKYGTTTPWFLLHQKALLKSFSCVCFFYRNFLLIQRTLELSMCFLERMNLFNYICRRTGYKIHAILFHILLSLVFFFLFLMAGCSSWEELCIKII